jgi:site-specific DNA recombinase
MKLRRATRSGRWPAAKKPPQLFAHNAVRIERVPIQDLRLNANNSRLHPKKQIVKLARAIKEFGFLIPARPALQQLLKDIDAGRIDVVVVYKIDRLTRSLADFAKLVEAFDAKSISFVAVTQQFNTTTSMGRLTLNVLLSFAQFERELSSERVRDKVAASRRKGKWTGGTVPLGYDARDKKLIVNKAEAETVRYIFKRYLEVQSFRRLVEDLDARGIVTKRRDTKVRKFNGGIAFTYGPLAHFLKNRLYIGETGHKDKWFPGEHAAIVDRKTFEQVQQLLDSKSAGRKAHRTASEALLMGKLYDDRGNRNAATNF